MADGFQTPLQAHVTKSVIDVAWEATQQLEDTFRRLIDAAPSDSGAQKALKEAQLMLKDYVFAELLELRLMKDERDEEPAPRTLSSRDVANYET